MRTFLSAAALCVAATFLAAVTVSPAGAYCFGWDPGYQRDYYGVPREFARSPSVIEARVTAVQWIDDNGKPTVLKPPFLAGGHTPMGFDPYAGAYYELDVLHQFKGHRRSHLRVFSENTDARTPLTVGRSYLLFVTREHEDLRDDGATDLGWQNVVDSCGNSTLLPAPPVELREIHRLSTAADAK